MSSIFIGVDPGNRGAIALLDSKNARAKLIDMPTHVFFTNKKRTTVDAHGVAAAMNIPLVSHAFVEDVYSSPQMGGVSAFNFGMGKGIIVGVLASLDIPFTMVKPQQWQKAMRCPADPKAAVARGTQLFPKFAAEFKGPRGGLFDGRAEALIIALYGSLEMGQAPSAVIEPW